MGDSFDLRSLTEIDRTWKLPRLAFAVIMLGAVGCQAVELFWSIATGFDWTTTTSVGASLLLAAALFIGVGCAGLPRLFRGATEIRLSSVGVHLCYPGGRQELQRWDDPAGFLLTGPPARPDEPAPGGLLRFSGPRFSSRRTFLTRAAYDAIVTEASRRGMAAPTNFPRRGADERPGRIVRWRPAGPSGGRVSFHG